MLTLLLRIATAGFLSLSSLLVILFRLSPLVSPAIAVPSFFLTLFVTVSSFSTLTFFMLWHRLDIEGMDVGGMMNIALREGIFIGLMIILYCVLQLLSVLTWWIALLILLVFFCVELALHS